ncbi:MAG: cytosine deaminase [Pseudomonadota bacterium]
MDFRTLPDPKLFDGRPITLGNLTIPACLLGQPGGLIKTDLSIEKGLITDTTGFLVDMQGAMVFPAFIDMHTHLDKGHIWARSSNPDGTFSGALEAVRADRSTHWTAGDIRRRMDFSLRCAYAHGTRAIRTHLDSTGPQGPISWATFREVRTEWSDRIALQAVCLVPIDAVPANQGDENEAAFIALADIVAESGGVLGAVTFPDPKLRKRLHQFFEIAAARGLAADFHTDETGDPGVTTLRSVAETVLETGFEAPVTVGHCCSLAKQSEADAGHTLDLVSKAGLHVVSLPMCNLYLQARNAGKTPSWRGITLVHEMKASGINVAFASDNTRDPFYAYGDLDMLEVMREATRISHLDHSDDNWTEAFLNNPARATGFAIPSLDAGSPADLVICKARSWTELFARPQADRIVLRAGQQINRSLPDYAELDDLMAKTVD